MEGQFKTVNTAGVFSITQWNTLADCMAKDFPACDNKFLEWKHRSVLHQYHLLERAFADIICLEEVDHPQHFESFLSATHNIFFHKKPDNEDGQLVAVSKDKFEIVDKKAHQYLTDNEKKVNNQSFWYLLLKEKQTNKHVLLFVTHLKAKKQFENVRVEQIQYFFKFLKDLQQNQIAKDAAIVFAGDFNAEPTFQCIENILKSGIFKSAYADMHLEFSTYKIREHNDVQCRIIDYIFYTDSHLQLISTKSLPSRQAIGPNGLPNLNFSSDHLSLTATFRII